MTRPLYVVPVYQLLWLIATTEHDRKSSSIFNSHYETYVYAESNERFQSSKMVIKESDMKHLCYCRMRLSNW
jgi:hypothetical protein